MCFFAQVPFLLELLTKLFDICRFQRWLQTTSRLIKTAVSCWWCNNRTNRLGFKVSLIISLFVSYFNFHAMASWPMRKSLLSSDFDWIFWHRNDISIIFSEFLLYNNLSLKLSGVFLCHLHYIFCILLDIWNDCNGDEHCPDTHLVFKIQLT